MKTSTFYTLVLAIATLLKVNADLHHAAIFAFGGGEPHVTTWSDERFEFYRQGDFVLVSNPDYANGLGLDIHVRTKAKDHWMFVESAVVRMGDEMIEVRGGLEHSRYWINGEEGFSALEPREEMKVWLKQGGVEVHIRQVNSQQFQLRVDLGNDEGILFETFREFVRVDVQGNDGVEGSFADSVGLMGSFPEGAKVGRDKASIIKSPINLAKEWQVQESTDVKIFRS